MLPYTQQKFMLLRSDKNKNRKSRSQLDVPLLILVTDGCASLFTVENLERPKQTTIYRPGMFSACTEQELSSITAAAETANGFRCISFFATVASFHVNEKTMVHGHRTTTRMQSGIVVVPPILYERDVKKFFPLLRNAMARAAETSSWITETSHYSERALQPKSMRKYYSRRFRPY